MRTDRGAGLAPILGEAAEYLNWLKDEGLTQVEASYSPQAKPGLTSAPVKPRGREPVTPAGGAVPSAVPAKAPEPVSAMRDLAAIAAEIAECRKCGLHRTRTKTVPGQGNSTPEIMFVGEAPGADEDAQGLAFVGAAGQLLTRMINAMGLTREEVFIGNILKCRPPDNRRPTPEEMATCIPYLKEQMRMLRPKVIVAMGGTAISGLLGEGPGVTKRRGTWELFEGIPVMPTYHPAYLLRNPVMKREAWEDLKSVLTRVGRTPPALPEKRA